MANLKPNPESKRDRNKFTYLDDLEVWLFEENVSYKDASARLLALSPPVKMSTSALGRWYKSMVQPRILKQIIASQKLKNAVVEKFKANPADTYNALLEVAGQIAFDKAMQAEKGLDAETIFNFTKLVMTGRKQAMEAEKLTLERDRFQFNAASACLKHLPTLRAIAGKTGTDQKEKIRQIRLALFGAAPE